MHLYRIPFEESELRRLKFPYDDDSPDSLASWTQTLRDSIINIADKESIHHIMKVVRSQVGEQLSLFVPGKGISFVSELREISLQSIAVKILSSRIDSPLAPVTVLVGLPEQTVCDSIAEKAVEVGISKIIFFGAQRSQAKDPQLFFEKRLPRLTRIVLSALKQSHAAFAPQIHFASSLADALTKLPPIENPPISIRILLTPGTTDVEGAQQPQDFSAVFRSQLAKLCVRHSELSLQKISKTVDTYLVIGPEGGLTETEQTLAQSFAFEDASLGVNTMRCETATIVAAGFARIMLQAS